MHVITKWLLNQDASFCRRSQNVTAEVWNHKSLEDILLSGLVLRHQESTFLESDALNMHWKCILLKTVRSRSHKSSNSWWLVSANVLKKTAKTTEGRKQPQQQHIPTHSGESTGWTCSDTINNTVTHLTHLSCPQLAVNLQSRCPENWYKQNRRATGFVIQEWIAFTPASTNGTPWNTNTDSHTCTDIQMNLQHDDLLYHNTSHVLHNLP